MLAVDPPARPLPRFVESVRFIEPTGGNAQRVDRLPDGRTALVFRAGRGSGDVTVFGPRTRALLKEAIGFDRAVVLQLEPGWAATLLGVPAHALADAFVDVQELWRDAGRDLVDGLLTAKSSPEVLDGFARALDRRTRTAVEPPSAILARRAVRLMEAGEDKVERVAARLGVTARHLRRAFAVNIGIAPKTFVRSLRLQRAVRMARSSSDWSRIAAHAGYYDQAHLIADFRDLVGLTPVAFVRRTGALNLR